MTPSNGTVGADVVAEFRRMTKLILRHDLDENGRVTGDALDLITAEADRMARAAVEAIGLGEAIEALDDAKVAIEAATAAFVFDEPTQGFLYATHEKLMAALANLHPITSECNDGERVDG